MSQIRTDQAQLIITVDARESAEYQKTLAAAAKGVADIKKLTVGQEDYNKALQEQADISRRLQSSTDYNRLSIKQLSDRRAQLVQLQRTLPGVTFAEAGLERELQQVNTALAESARRTRAVSQEMNDAAPAATGFAANFKKGLAFLAPLGIIEGIRQIGGALFGLAKDSVVAFDGAAKAEAQLEAAIKSTGAAAGKSVEELIAQSSELQKITLYSDDQIQEAQGLLLTFTKVQGSIYDQAIPAITDMAAAMKTDLSTASIQVGKALNDPIKGVGALSKAGVQFTAEQKATIKTLVETGDVAGAQTIILKELETQFNGSAKAAADAGLGPLQKFQNRIGDIQEGIGLLITNGLSFLGPILDKVATFAEKFVGVLVSGKKATGEMSGAVNFLVGALKLVYNTISGLVSAFTFLWDAQNQLFDSLKDLPIIGGIVKAFANTFNFIIDAVTNTSAVFAGLKAAIQQTFDNASNYIKKTLTDIKIFAKEADLLLSFKDSTKARIKEEIKALEAESDQYAKAGKTVGQAYTDAYNEVITKELKARDVVADIDKPLRPKGFTKEETDKERKAREKAEKEAEKELKKKKEQLEKERDDLLSINFYDPAKAQVALDMRLKQLEDAEKRAQDVLYESFLAGKITEDEYNLERIRSQTANLETRINLLDAYGQKETDKRRELNIKLLEAEKELLGERAQQIADIEAEGLTYVEQRFRDKLITEEEREISLLKVAMNANEMKLQMLRDQGLTETEVYKTIMDEQLALQYDYDTKKLESTKRTEAMRQAVAEQGFQAASDLLSLGAELLGQDEKARKKHASAIKAFEVAKIAINLQKEISAIWSNANANPTNILIPGWANIWAGIQTGLAVGRSVLSVGKIKAQQFKYGGSLLGGGTFQGPSHDNGGVPFRVGGQIHEAEGGEVIINKRSSAIFKDALNAINTYGGYGRPIYMTGGTVPSTQPIGLGGVAISSPPVQSDPRVEMLARSVSELTQAIPMALSNINATINYNHLTSEVAKIDDIKRQAGY